MDTLILGDSIIKYLQKDFVHKNVHVKAFPGYNISRLHARLDTDVVSNYSNIILHVGVNDVTNASPAIILQKYEAMLAIACAESLVRGDDPSDLRFDQNLMSDHLIHCLENNQFTVQQSEK